MEDDRKTVLKITLLNLCDMLSNDQIEGIIDAAEDLLSVQHIYKQVEVHSL